MTPGDFSMAASKTALDMIESFEGFSEVVYPDVEGNATIGYGTLLHEGPPTDADRKLKWSRAHAQEALKNEVLKVEAALNRSVRVKLNQNQFDSLVVWTYNLGIGTLREDRCSWLRELNKGYYEYVPALMTLYNKVRVNGKLVTSAGLLRRRQEEGALFARPMVAAPDPEPVQAPPEASSPTPVPELKKTTFPKNWR